MVRLHMCIWAECILLQTACHTSASELVAFTSAVELSLFPFLQAKHTYFSYRIPDLVCLPCFIGFLWHSHHESSVQCCAAQCIYIYIYIWNILSHHLMTSFWFCIACMCDFFFLIQSGNLRLSISTKAELNFSWSHFCCFIPTYIACYVQSND